MSTLTLSVEEFFKPELTTSVSNLAAGSALSAHKLGKNSRLAPEFRSQIPKYLVDGYLRSTPELGTQVAMNSEDEIKETPRAKDDCVMAFNAYKHFSQKQGASTPESSFSPFVEIPQVILAIPEQLPKASYLEKIIESPSFMPRKQRSASEELAAPPLRKLKLSLKLPNLTKLHSMPQLSPKSVRFASRLEKIKMFDGKASPSTVSLQCTPLGSPKYDFPVEDYFSIRHHYADFSDDEDCSSSDSDTYTEFTKNRQYKISLNNFVLPQNIYDKRESPVYLQSVFLTADKKLLVLVVMCQNLAFEKHLSVKLTFNDWHSLMIYNSAVYTKLFSSVNFDQFKFTIPLTNLPSSLTTQFCLKYSVYDDTFWDNNGGKNYTLSLEKYWKPSVSKDMFNFKPSVKTDSFSYKPPTFSPPNANKPAEPKLESDLKSGTTVRQYHELVSKLMSVQDAGEQPKFTRSLTLSPKPRYSQSYISKMGSDSNGKSSPSECEPTNFAPTNDGCLGSENLSAFKEKNDKAAIPSRPQMPHLFASAPVTLSSKSVGSMSYADLLQNYCFNGADKGSNTINSNTNGSFNSSCNSSSSSVSSAYLTPASTFQSMTDSFYV